MRTIFSYVVIISIVVLMSVGILGGNLYYIGSSLVMVALFVVYDGGKRYTKKVALVASELYYSKEPKYKSRMNAKYFYVNHFGKIVKAPIEWNEDFEEVGHVSNDTVTVKGLKAKI